MPGKATLPTVLDLLAVTWWFFQGPDDEGGSTGQHLHASLTVLNDQLHGDLQPLPLGRRLGNVITNLLG